LAAIKLQLATLISTIDGFEPSPTLAVAVSGGADSMALLLLTHAWTKQHGGTTVALTIDHGLRPEAAQEAAQVHGWCKKRGIEHHILKAKDIQKKTQEEARNARYQLLAEWCKKNGVRHLLTAHHQGDQAETFFFRLARGSNIEGLACIPAISDLHGIRLIRPLLNVPKSALEDFLRENNQPWIEDPTNKNPRYTRNRIRAHIAASDNPEEISRRAADLAQRFGRIRGAMEQDLAQRLPDVLTLSEDEGFLYLEPFLALPPVYGVKTLSLLAQKLGNRPYPPRSEKLERLYDDIVHGRIRKQRSFGGLLFIVRKNGLLIRREPKTLEKSAAALHIH